MKNTYNELLSGFTSIDPYRIWMNNPFCINGKAYSTDAHVIFIAPLEKTQHINGIRQEGKEKMVLSVIPEERNMNFKINVDSLRSEISKTPLVDEYIDTDVDGKCNECCGEGMVEWEYLDYTRDMDCPACDGSGSIEETKRTKTGNKIINPLAYVDIKNSRFKIYYILKLIEAAERLNCKEFFLTNQTLDNRASIFSIGDCELLLMPITKTDKDKVIYTIL